MGCYAVLGLSNLLDRFVQTSHGSHVDVCTVQNADRVVALLDSQSAPSKAALQ